MTLRVRSLSQHDDPGGPLEQQLRRLPPPAVPAGLEARLVAAAPDVAPGSSKFRPLRCAGAAVAAAVVAVVMLRPSPSDNRCPGTTPFENTRETAPFAVLPAANS